MKNEIAIKVYEVDYSFIIKNYLDKELWHRSWTLFVYKDYVFNINLSSIDVKDETIVFEVKCDKLHYSWEADVWNDSVAIRHNIKNSNINVLKRQINGAIFDIIEKIEKIKICESEEYQEIANYYYEEKEELSKIANDFLDDNNVTNRDIRDAYVDKYVASNSTVSNKKSEYRKNKRYNVLTDLYLVFVRAIEDKDKESFILSMVDSEKAETVLNEVNDYMKKLQTEEYKEELKEELEDI